MTTILLVAIIFYTFFLLATSESNDGKRNATLIGIFLVLCLMCYKM